MQIMMEHIMKKKGFRVFILMVFSIILTSCMPEEEILPALPIMQSQVKAQYTIASVKRGDIAVTKKIPCTYVPAKTENLSFRQGGVYIDHVYVSQGQSVKAGELLATLDHEDLKEEISALEYQLEVYSLKRKHLLERKELDILNIQVTSLNEESYIRDQKCNELERSYQKQLQDIDDSIYILNIRLEEMQDKLKDRQIYAGFDGTVTYVETVTEGQRSVMGETIITISDYSTSVFTATGENAQFFPVGTKASLVLNDEEYVVQAVDGASLGLNETLTDEKDIAYLQLLQPDPSLKDKNVGTVQITLDQRKNVLYVEKTAVKMSNGEPFVYLLNEDGLRILQKVSTGLDTGTELEILEGLAEGDRIIIE